MKSSPKPYRVLTVSFRITSWIRRLRSLLVSAIVLLMVPAGSLPSAPDLDINSAVSDWVEKCREWTSCSSRSFADSDLSPSRFLLNLSCHCDPECATFGDCCGDYGDNGTDVGVSSRAQHHYTCQLVREVDLNAGVYLIATCPEDWDNDFVRSRCEGPPGNDTLLSLPVVSAVRGDNYRNIFCSFCHRERHVLYWKVETCCKKTSVTADYTGSGGPGTVCETVYLPPSDQHSYRQCRQSVSTCPGASQGSSVAELCANSGPVYVFSRNTTYKNIYCSLCNNVPMTDVYCAEPSGIHRTSLCHARRRKLPYSFKVLLDMNKNRRTVSTRVGRMNMITSTLNITRRRRCPDHAVYDPFIGSCRAAWCQTLNSPNMADCDSDTEDHQGNNSTYTPVRPADPGCQWIRFNNTQYQLYTNGTIFIEAHQKVYRPAEFRLSGRHAFVCVQFTQNYTEYQLGNLSRIAFNFSQTQVYLSLVGLLLSLIALAAQMIVYALLPPLRNVPGKNLMCLVGSLFLAELLFLVAPSLEAFGDHACKTIAILMHYGFLAAFCWMQVMSFDIWYTFSRKSLHSPSGGRSKAWRLYNVYGWTTPALVVGSAVGVDSLCAPEFALRPLYGDGICWIANRSALIAFFAGPVAAIVLSNIASFVLTVRNIVEVDKSTSIVQNSSEKRRFFLYVKLCFLMGIAWVFGLLAAFTEVQALWYLFVILNTLQGMFICVAFVCTRKVLRLLREKYPCGAAKARGTASSTTGRTSLSSRSTQYVVVGKKQ